MSTRGWKGPLLLVVVLLMVNLPVAHSTWLSWQVSRSGVEVTARVADDTVTGGRSYVGFVLPDEIDGEPVAEDERGWTVEVDEDTRAQAVADGTIEVRVLPDRPSAYSVDGQVTSWSPWVITLLVDLLVLALAGLMWRFRTSLRPRLVLLASGDVERCPPGSALDRVEGDEYVVRGEVSEIGEDSLVLDLGDRQVLVELDGHHNPVGHQQAAQVRGRLVG